MDWLYFTNEATGGTFEAPDEEGVRERYEALGWVLTDKPADEIFVPSKLNQTGTEQEWVTLYHPKVKATHEFPNNTEALAGAAEAGWEPLPAPDPRVPDPPAEDQKPDSKPDPKAKAPAKAVATEEK